MPTLEEVLAGGGGGFGAQPALPAEPFEPLPDRLRTVQSEQATALQGADPAPADVYAVQRTGIQQHQQFAQRLQQEQDQVDLRGRDLAIAPVILAALDPTSNDRGTRKQLLGELSQELGINLDSPGNVRRVNYLASLPPDSRSQASRYLSGKVSTTAPGGGVEFVRAFLAEEIPLAPILADIRATARQQPAGRAAFVAAHGPPSMLGADEAVVADPAATPAAPPGQPAAQGTSQLLQVEGQREAAFFLALDHAIRMEEASRGADATVGRTSFGVDLPSVRGVNLGRVQVPAWARFETNLADYQRSIEPFIDLPHIVGGLFDPLRRLIGREELAVRRYADRVIALTSDPVNEEGTAGKTGIRGLTSRETMDRHNDIKDWSRFFVTGLRAATGQDVEMPTGSARDVGRALVSTMASAYETIMLSRANSSLNSRVPFNLNALSPEQLQRAAYSELSPRPLREQAQAHIAQQQAQTPPAAQAPPGQPAPAGQPRLFTRLDEPETAYPPPPAAPAAPVQQQAPPRSVAETAAQETARGRRQAEADRAFTEESRRGGFESVTERLRFTAQEAITESRRRAETHDRQGRAEQRDIEREFQRRVERRETIMRQAIAQFAAALGSAPRGSTSVAAPRDSGGDDAGAFRMSPSIQRRGPAPVQARRRAQEN